LAASLRKFRNLIKTLCRTSLDEWSARSKGLYLDRMAQHRNTKTNVHASIRVLTHHPSNQASRTYALARHRDRHIRVYTLHLG
jgi:hypothetical protein